MRDVQWCMWGSMVCRPPTYRLVASASEKPVLMVQWYIAPCSAQQRLYSSNSQVRDPKLYCTYVLAFSEL